MVRLFKRGSTSEFAPKLKVGEFGFCLDTNVLFLGTKTGNEVVTDFDNVLEDVVFDVETNELVFTFQDDTEKRIPFNYLAEEDLDTITEEIITNIQSFLEEGE